MPYSVSYVRFTLTLVANSDFRRNSARLIIAGICGLLVAFVLLGRVKMTWNSAYGCYEWKYECFYVNLSFYLRMACELLSNQSSFQCIAATAPLLRYLRNSCMCEPDARVSYSICVCVCVFFSGNMQDYIPRKCTATNKVIGCKDHASIQLNIGNVDANGRFTNSYHTVCFAGHVRTSGESDAQLNR